ncbi:hypothetical protein EIP91_004025 [Steccherinum ochraceum]|uniref:Uncharacterized protein n=1 Tax=Steccherinum ochraceum TaxID=92696 RepID=A0A4V2MW33_9APHY|nr:hypothetical protein EIP91_004025 [Steccherinum ochraceum]
MELPYSARGLAYPAGAGHPVLPQMAIVPQGARSQNEMDAAGGLADLKERTHAAKAITQLKVPTHAAQGVPQVKEEETHEGNKLAGLPGRTGQPMRKLAPKSAW